jgi:hypothetical protein
MVTRRAQCACGQLAAVCTGEPVRVSVCHCLDCKRRSGSAFSYTSRFPVQDVAVSGRSNEFVRIGDEGGRATFRFCPDCGVTVCYALDNQPQLIAIPVGGFADPAFPQPAFSVYDVRRHPWVGIHAEPLEVD